MPRRRSAVWGYGNHAKAQIIPAMLMSECFDLAAIGSRRFATPESHVIQGKEITFCSERELLADVSIDTVYVSTPSGLHHDHCLAALNAGKNVLCEKPLTTSAERSRELIRLARDKGLFLAETFMYLFHPQFAALSELLRSEALGRIVSVTCEFGLPPLEKPGFRESALLGGGAFWDLGCYGVSAVLHLLSGRPEVIHVSVTMAGQDDAATDRSGAALLRFDAGTHVFLTWGYDLSYRNHLTAWGDGGAVMADRVFSKKADYSSRIETSDKRGVRHVLDTGHANAFVNMLDYIGGHMDETACRDRFLAVAERQAEAMEQLVRRAPAGTLRR